MSSAQNILKYIEFLFLFGAFFLFFATHTKKVTLKLFSIHDDEGGNSIQRRSITSSNFLCWWLLLLIHNLFIFFLSFSLSSRSVRASQGIRRTKEMKRFMYYSLYAWGFPFLMVRKRERKLFGFYISINNSKWWIEIFFLCENFSFILFFFLFLCLCSFHNRNVNILAYLYAL